VSPELPAARGKTVAVTRLHFATVFDLLLVLCVADSSERLIPSIPIAVTRSSIRRVDTPST
jgi:hypothetical protein